MRDIQWVDDQLLIVAIASALVLMRIPQQQRGELVTINFPPFHKVMRSLLSHTERMSSLRGTGLHTRDRRFSPQA